MLPEQANQLGELLPSAHETAIDIESLGRRAESAHDYIERNKAAWNRWASGHITAGRRSWQADELRWGLWGTRESTLHLLDGFGSGENCVELGSGTAAISAWLSRRGLRPVAVDISHAQLSTAETFQRESGLRFPLVPANAEQVPFDNESFDLAISEYGASLWCDPRRWLPEAHRLLRPEGRLIFFTNSALLMTCMPLEGEEVGDRLVRDYFSRYSIEFEPDGSVEFHLTHGDWIRLLRATGFVVENLIEVQPHPAAKPRFAFVSPEWAQRWPSEDIWIANKSS
jgi:SAM-dependent methyltransferase